MKLKIFLSSSFEQKTGHSPNPSNCLLKLIRMSVKCVRALNYL
jgi:hypothetical protein